MSQPAPPLPTSPQASRTESPHRESDANSDPVPPERSRSFAFNFMKRHNDTEVKILSERRRRRANGHRDQLGITQLALSSRVEKKPLSEQRLTRDADEEALHYDSEDEEEREEEDEATCDLDVEYRASQIQGSVSSSPSPPDPPNGLPMISLTHPLYHGVSQLSGARDRVIDKTSPQNITSENPIVELPPIEEIQREEPDSPTVEPSDAMPKTETPESESTQPVNPMAGRIISLAGIRYGRRGRKRKRKRVLKTKKKSRTTKKQRRKKKNTNSTTTTTPPSVSSTPTQPELTTDSTATTDDNTSSSSAPSSLSTTPVPLRQQTAPTATHSPPSSAASPTPSGSAPVKSTLPAPPESAHARLMRALDRHKSTQSHPAAPGFSDYHKLLRSSNGGVTQNYLGVASTPFLGEAAPLGAFTPRSSLLKSHHSRRSAHSRRNRPRRSPGPRRSANGTGGTTGTEGTDNSLVSTRSQVDFAQGIRPLGRSRSRDGRLAIPPMTRQARIDSTLHDLNDAKALIIRIGSPTAISIILTNYSPNASDIAVTNVASRLIFGREMNWEHFLRLVNSQSSDFRPALGALKPAIPFPGNDFRSRSRHKKSKELLGEILELRKKVVFRIEERNDFTERDGLGLVSLVLKGFLDFVDIWIRLSQENFMG